MPVIVSRNQIDAVKAALAGVKSNGQARAACLAAVKAAKDLAAYLRKGGGAIRQASAGNLDVARKPVEVAAEQLAGTPTAAAGKVWADAQSKVFYVYMLAYTIQSTVQEGDLGDGWGAALMTAVAELPRNIATAAVMTAKDNIAVAKKVVKQVSKDVGEVAGAVAGGAAGITWELVKGLWPVLAIAGVVIVGVVVVSTRLPGLKLGVGS